MKLSSLPFILLPVCALLSSCSGTVQDEVQKVIPAAAEIDFSDIPVLGDAAVIYSEEGRYEAFTDIIRFDGKYYVSFRDGHSHIWEEDGTAQGRTFVLSSEDGENWTRVLDQAEAGIDLRDPKLSVTPDGRLMVLAGGSRYGNLKETSECFNRTPRVSFSRDGKSFSAPCPVIFDNVTGNDWLWRVTWRGRKAYGVVKGDQYALFTSRDGLNYRTVKKFGQFTNGVEGDETTLRFLKDGTMLLLARTRDMTKKWKVGTSLWGVSKPPYRDWTFKEIPMGFGGPNFIVMDEKYVIVATRWLRDDEHKTVLLKGDLEGNLTPVCVLPSGGSTGNCSYPGLLVVGDELWVSYYSQHETAKPAIYLVKYPLSMFD